MVSNDDALNHSEKDKFTPFEIWEKGGLTEHLGGIHATRRLLTKCHLSPGQQILDIGCGTGVTACYAAKNYLVKVIALDVNQRNITEARKRVSNQRAASQVQIVWANGHKLPFSNSVFDTVTSESVLVFCDAATVIAEMYRVLKPGSIFSVNELTLLKSPPATLVSLLIDTFGIYTFQQCQWESLFCEAGFKNVKSSVYHINLWEQLVSHVEVDGLLRYLTALVTGMKDASIRNTFFTKEMLIAACDFLPYVGYGIYTGNKPGEVSCDKFEAETVEKNL